MDSSVYERRWGGEGGEKMGVALLHWLLTLLGDCRFI